MTNEEAIELIENDMRLHHDYLSGKYRHALRMAVDALKQADHKTEPSDSEKPNNCETCANGEGDIEACGYCRHGDLYEPKTEPQNHSGEVAEMVEPQTVYGEKCGGGAIDPIRTCYPELFKDEPQTCANGCRWLNQDGECTEPNGECHIEYRTEVDEPQTEEGCPTCKYGRHGNITDEERCDMCSYGTTNNYEPIEPQAGPCDRYVVTNDEGEREYNCIGCERTDCAWKKGEE